MKKIFLLFSVAFLFNNAIAQNQPTSVPPVFWNLSGNTAANSDFLGTRNFTPLVFRTNNVDRIRISERGDIILPEIANGVQQIIMAEGDGKLRGMLIKDLVNEIYTPVPECAIIGGGDPSTATYSNTKWSSKTNVGYGIVYTGTPCPARVGIGTDNPAYALHVKGIIGGQKFISNIFSGTDKAFSVFNNQTNKEEFVVLGNGYLGLGTGTPTCNLHIKASDGNADFCLESTNGYKWDLSSNDNGLFTLYQPSTGQARMVVDQNGKMGIGTASPERTFDVRGDVFVSERAKIGGQSNTIEPYALDVFSELDGMRVTSYGATSYLYKAQASSSTSRAYAVFNGTGKETFTVLGSGQTTVNIDDQNSIAFNVMYDDGSSSSKKDVFRIYGNGKIYSTEVHVSLKSSFPDYVFNKEYDLMPLYKLEKYIAENKHLPNIPSAKEVKENGGINLGEMNIKLLEKVEELTLYVIELKKQIDELKKEK